MRKLALILIILIISASAALSAGSGQLTLTFNERVSALSVNANLGQAYGDSLYSVFITAPDAADPTTGQVYHIGAGQLDFYGAGKYTLQLSPPEEAYKIFFICQSLTIEEVFNIADIIYEYDPLSDMFGLPSVYPAISGGDTKARFFERRAELPDEMPIVYPRKYRADDKYVFYVDDKNGRDNYAGSFSSPVKTLKKALEKVSQISASEKAFGVSIFLREGTYLSSSAISLTSAHSGTLERPLYIGAYNNERVTFEMGTKIPYTLFEKAADPEVLSRLNPLVRDKISVFDLSLLNITDLGDASIYGNLQNQPVVYLNGEELTSARYPNTGAVSVGKVINLGKANGGTASGVSFGFLDERPLFWKNTGDIAIYGAIGVEWNPVRILINNIDKQNHALISNDSPSDGATESDDPRYFDWGGAPTSYYYYNVFEELDTPGEYYLDRNNMTGGRGKLYIYDDGAIDGSSYFTYGVRAKSELELTNVQNAVISGLNLRNGSHVGINMTNCDRVVVQNCEIGNFASEGVLINQSRLCGLTECYVYNTHRAAVEIGQNNTEYSNLIPCRNFVQNCYLGRQDNDEQTGGIAMGNTVGNIISHNLIQNYAAYAIAPGGCENIVEYNEIVGAPRRVGDMAPVYWAGMLMRGTHVRYNYIHDQSYETKYGHGIYFDELGSDCYAYGNIISGFESGIYTHGGQGIVAYNNVVLGSKMNPGRLFSDAYSFYDIYNGVWQRNIFNTNGGGLGEYLNYPYRIKPKIDPWKSRYPDLYQYILKLDRYFTKFPGGNTNSWNGSRFSDADEEYIRAPRDNYVANNISYKNGGLSMTAIGVSTACEISDNYITSTNPGFYDLENKDFRMNPTSAVMTAIPSFTPPPFAQMGIETEDLAGGAITLRYPENNAEVLSGSIKLDWNAVKYASLYEVDLSYEPDFSNIIARYKTLNSDYTINLKESGQKIYWRVTAKSDVAAYKNSSIVSGIGCFSVISYDREKLLTDGHNGMGISSAAVDTSRLVFNDALLSMSDKISVSFDLDFASASVAKFSLKNGYFFEFEKGNGKQAPVRMYKDAAQLNCGRGVYNTVSTQKYRARLSGYNTAGTVTLCAYITPVLENGEYGEEKLCAVYTDSAAAYQRGGFSIIRSQAFDVSNVVIRSDVYDYVEIVDFHIIKSANEAVFKLKNNSGGTVTPRVFLAAYNGEGRLTEVRTVTSSAILNGDTSGNLTINVSENASLDAIKIFVWDDEIKPYRNLY